MSRCFIQFAQVHSEFRLPELESIAELHGFKFFRPDVGSLPRGIQEDWDPSRPYWIIDFEEEAHARMISERCILVKSVYEMYGTGSSYDSVHEQSRVKEIVESFVFMDFQGPIDLKNAELSLGIFEDYANDINDRILRQIYFGRLIAEGKARRLIHTFNVKKRRYFGNTSMEAEISLLMANQALAAPGKFIYDPFVGTGSMAYTAAHFGAFVFGSDIDGRQMRGKKSPKETGILRAAEQYGSAERIIDLCTYDITHNPLRCGGLFDAIITDPPYGVRAGAKRLGRKSTDKREANLKYGEAQRKGLFGYIPPTQPYELSELVEDLVRLARYLLRPNGRLVFFLPTVTDEYTAVDVYSLLCEGMEVIANSVQSFGSWGRRLITIKKITDTYYPSPFDASEQGLSAEQDGRRNNHVPTHKDFREKYFKGFRRNEADGPAVSPEAAPTSAQEIALVVRNE